MEEHKLNTELENRSWKSQFQIPAVNKTGIELVELQVPPADTNLKVPSPDPASNLAAGVVPESGLAPGRGAGGWDFKLLQGFCVDLQYFLVCNLFGVTS